MNNLIIPHQINLPFHGQQIPSVDVCELMFGTCDTIFFFFFFFGKSLTANVRVEKKRLVLKLSN